MLETKDKTQEQDLKNSYVEEFYNDQVASLESNYTQSRWFSSPERTFEYNQTLRALTKALGTQSYEKALEIGPGDAVWTPVISAAVNQLHLVEQSEVMYTQALQKLKDNEKNITVEHADFSKSEPPQENNLIVAMRCFEYFDDKAASLKKMHSLLAQGGSLVIVTKNADLYTTKGVQDRLIHSDQLTKSEMVSLLKEAGFTVESVYPATLRWKSSFAVSRMIFTLLHKLSVATNGGFSIPFLFPRATESYTYVAKRV